MYFCRFSEIHSLNYFLTLVTFFVITFSLFLINILVAKCDYHPCNEWTMRSRTPWKHVQRKATALFLQCVLDSSLKRMSFLLFYQHYILWWLIALICLICICSGDKRTCHETSPTLNNTGIIMRRRVEKTHEEEQHCISGNRDMFTNSFLITHSL